MTNKNKPDIIKTQRTKERKIKMTLERLNKEYYEATKRKDWKEAKRLLEVITNLEAERLKKYYTGLGCFK